MKLSDNNLACLMACGAAAELGLHWKDQTGKKTFNTTPHLNRTKVKQTALEIAGQTRGQGWTRVGRSFLQRIEAATHAAIVAEVRRHPSKGKTLL